MLQIYEFGLAVWETMESLALWLFVGLGIAGILHLWVSDDFVKRHLGQGRFSMILKAALLGVPLPLCSCGVIPASIGIKKQGASDGAAMSFLISTPQTGVDSIAVSVSFLGWPFALVKLAAAFVMGLIGGVLVGTNTVEDQAKNDDKPAKAIVQKDRSLREFMRFTIDDLLKDIWVWLLVGILISAAIQTWIPPDYLKQLPFMVGLPALLIVMLAALPLYVCATASVPIAAALVHAGMPTGAALVFLIAGPASNAATMGAIYKTFGKRFLVVYLTVIGVGSLLVGYLFDSVLSAVTNSPLQTPEEGGLLVTISALALVGLMIRFTIKSSISMVVPAKCSGD